MTDQIQAAAEYLSRTESSLSDAIAVEDGARSEVSDLEAKIAAVQSRKSQIRADLATGALTEAQAGGMFQIASADEGDLVEMLASADAQLDTAIAEKQKANMTCERARQALMQAERRQVFDELTVRVAQIDAALMAAVAELVVLGGALGLNGGLASVWRPSDALQNAIIHRIPPRRVPS
jgi:chromosome segregation ATPase